MERDAVFPEPTFNYLKHSRETDPPAFPKGPYGGRCPSPEPSSTYKSLVNEPSSRLPIVAVTEDLTIWMLCRAVQIKESYMSDNGTNERCPLSLKLVHILCTITGQNIDSN
jgi:hypothetical protein